MHGDLPVVKFYFLEIPSPTIWCRLGWHRWNWEIRKEDEWLKAVPGSEIPEYRVCRECYERPG